MVSLRRFPVLPVSSVPLPYACALRSAFPCAPAGSLPRVCFCLPANLVTFCYHLFTIASNIAAAVLPLLLHCSHVLYHRTCPVVVEQFATTGFHHWLYRSPTVWGSSYADELYGSSPTATTTDFEIPSPPLPTTVAPRFWCCLCACLVKLPTLTAAIVIILQSRLASSHTQRATTTIPCAYLPLLRFYLRFLPFTIYSSSSTTYLITQHALPVLLPKPPAALLLPVLPRLVVIVGFL